MNAYQESIKKIQPEFDKVIQFLEREVAKIRTGRASPTLVEDVSVDCFGNKFPLKQLAAISLPEPRTVLIQPWDKSYIEPIERALSQSSLGISPVVDKETIRLTLPPLSQDYRKNLLRLLSEKREDANKTIRHWREEAWRKIQEEFKAKEIREDDKFRAKDELQKLVDQYHEKVEKIVKNKEKEVAEN